MEQVRPVYYLGERAVEIQLIVQAPQTAIYFDWNVILTSDQIIQFKCPSQQRGYFLHVVEKKRDDLSHQGVHVQDNNFKNTFLSFLSPSQHYILLAK